MSQFQQRAHHDTPGSTLNYNHLMDQQRQLLKDITPSTLEVVKSQLGCTTNKLKKSNDLQSEDEDAWISNWQFQRIESDKKPKVIDSVQTEIKNKTESDASGMENEGGIFYFERIQQKPAAPIITSNPSVISTSDRNIAVVSQISSSLPEISDDNDFDQHDFLDMTIDNDDLFADLEAAADSNDDSEISLEDLMDMDLDDDQQVHDHDDNFMRTLNTSQNTSLHDVNDFLNKSTSAASAALMNDEDFEMMDNDDHDNVYNFSSPITSKDTISLSFSSLPSSSSPTSVAHHLAPPPLMASACSMSSATTRPALQQMRKMMTDLMDNGTMPRSRHDSRLPCAEGMDEMYLDTLRKLSASMERSKKTRQSLSIPMQTMQSSAHYSRSLCVNQILQSVQTSSRHVDTCLRSVRMLSR